MTDRLKYESELLQRIHDICAPKPAPFKLATPRLSDEDLSNEHIAIARYKLARKVFEETLRDGVLPLTSLRADRIQDILEMLEDASPAEDIWVEDIAKARTER